MVHLRCGFINTLFLSLVLFGLAFASDGDGENLRFVLLVTRHGARTPVTPVPANSTITKDTFNIQLGDLTDQGERQHYLLSRKLAKNYRDVIDFIPKTFDPRQINIFSTNFNRTIMSAYSELLGYFPFYQAKNLTKQEQVRAKTPFEFVGEVDVLTNLREQPTLYGFNPIPIHVGFTIDQMMRGMDADICPYQTKLAKQYEFSNDWITVNDKYQQILFPEMIQKFNANNATLNVTTAYPYVDNYYSAWFDQMEITNPLTQKAQDQIGQILHDGLYELKYGLDLAVRLATTRFLNFIHATLENKINAIINPDQANDYYKNIKFIYISAHDFPIAAFMSGLQEKQAEQVYFASFYITELRQKSNANGTKPEDFTVRMSYNGKPFNIGGNQTCPDIDCDFTLVKAFLKSREYNGDLDQICFSKDDNKKTSAAAKAWTIVLFITIGVIIAANVIYFALLNCSNKKETIVAIEAEYDSEQLKVNMTQTQTNTTRLISEEEN